MSLAQRITHKNPKRGNKLCHSLFNLLRVNKLPSIMKSPFKISIVFFGIFFTLFHQQEAFNFHDKVSTT